MIVAQDLHKSFRTPTGVVRAVEGVRFTARDGEITGLLGPNGAGTESATIPAPAWTLATPSRM